MNISHLTPTFSDIKTWVRAAAVSVNQLITGKQDKSDNLTGLSGLDLTGHSGDAVVVTAGEDGFELVAGGGGGGGTTTNALTITNTGGAAPGTTFDGSVARTIDYSTVGAAASGHNHSGVYQPADTTLDAFAAYNTNGLIAQTAADTFTGRTLTGPAAGITVTNGNGVAGNPTLALANDLSALEAMSGTGIVARTASETYAQRTITAGAGISVTNGDGVSGNPTIAVSGWVLISSTTPAGNTSFTNLGGYTELLVVCRDITTSSTGFRFIQVSVDNGSSWLTTSGDYKTINATGATTNQGDIAGHSSTQSTASLICRITGNLAGSTKMFQSVDKGQGFIANSGAITNAINAIRVNATTTINGGKIDIYGRV